MKSKLCILEGHRLGKVEQVEDYVQLVFDEGIRLNIYSNFTISGEHNLTDFAGKTIRTITEVFVKPECVVFTFEDESRLHIDLSEPDPEAMELHVPGESIVVWN